ncbi:bifunctional phosphoribosyl-AMP cyclohydrolase/phosphoribosyl-ATP diphosphatase HisIE [Buchnera aphidicola (Taiwanaphis decaspermi)]|uniref:bifunctional phosphoribosyl-AMP cyclohydrolase/phosphoribosyl-ATP diphosphatase HisIE n=1 Tax=Buchnera aphidicola TaxID=9 RepID=UPI0031B8B334
MLKEKIIEHVDWEKVNNLLPTIIQHNFSGEILMHGYMNKDALQKSISTKLVTFYSRVKKRLWTKGETSGNFLNLIEYSLDCDKDCLLILANPINDTSCHLKKRSCFDPLYSKITFLYLLEKKISRIKNNFNHKSYTSQLYKKGVNKIAQKVGEEGVEVAIASVLKDSSNLINEVSDLIYHILVLLQSQNISFFEIISNLKKRNNKLNK